MSEKIRKDKGKKRIIMKIIMGLILLAIMILWSGGFFRSKLPPGQVKAQTGIPIPAEVKTFKVESTLVAPRIDLVGTVASEENILLSARISAHVKRIFVSAGERVKEGQVLIKLDDRELKEQFAAAEAGLQQAQIEYERSQKLMAADATTDQALTAAKSAFETARARFQQIKVMLTFTEIKSPIDGKVTDRRIEAGDLANAGQVLLGVFAPQNMRLEVPVPVRLVQKLQLGEVVDIELDRPSRPFTGKVTEVVGEIDPMSRTQRVKVLINEVSPDLLPGTFGRVWISDAPRPAILVPASSVYRIGQLEIVQVVKENSAIRRLVKTGPRYGDMIEILSGLSENDIILAEPIKG